MSSKFKKDSEIQHQNKAFKLRKLKLEEEDICPLCHQLVCECDEYWDEPPEDYFDVFEDE